MKKIIMLKYAELNTKKDNIGMFLKSLKRNLEDKLSNYNANITFDKGRMFITCDEDNLEKCIDVCMHTFGILEIMVGYELPSNKMDNVESELINLIKNKEFKTFKVETQRSDKTYFMTSPEISKHLGGVILKNKENISVDVHNPEVIIHVEIRKEHAYIYVDTYKGLGGYPIGTLGKGMLMLSGGIDSPVAGFLAMKRGIKLEAVYFESPPHTSVEAKNKVLKLSSIIGEYGSSIKVHVVPFTHIQEEIIKHIPKDYLVTIMRRMMYRISAKIAYRNNCKVIINGESIGQVASQTLESMSVINETIKMPVIRPVACFDKLEIIDLAKRIGTYETSILPYEDCCTIFVPNHPVIHPELDKCLEYEKNINVDELIKEAIENEQVVKYEEKYIDLL